jgi:hypothetical protein
MSAEPLSEGLCPECTTPKCCSSGAGCDRPSAGAKAALASEFRSIIAGWLTAHTNASGAPDKLSVQLANHAFRLIAASRPTDRGEPVADDLLRRAQELAERAPLGHWSNTEDGETLWLMAEALRDRSPATTPYAQDLSEPRPAMATGHDLKDHPKWEGDLRERVAGEVRKILQHGWACGRERGGKGTDEQCRADADVHVENYTARLIAMLASTPSPEGE